MAKLIFFLCLVTLTVLFPFLWIVYIALISLAFISGDDNYEANALKEWEDFERQLEEEN